MTTDLAPAFELLAWIATEVPRYRGNLLGFAASPDALDRFGPEGLRNAARDLATLVAHDREAAEQAGLALSIACESDAWAGLEIAGRFASACRRLRLIARIERHPRAARFDGLVSALRRGKFTAEQWQLAQRVAAEVA